MDAKLIKITGRVQGVGFRYFVKHKALKLGIVGYVKNLDDGSVEVFCQGNDSDLKKFIEYLHKGPFFSCVKNLEINEVPQGEHKEFIII